MTFPLPPLPYAKDALEPHMSEETLTFHHDKHLKAYVDKVNDLNGKADKPAESIEEIVKATAGKAESKVLFNNAAQVWNHEFFFKSLAPKGGGKPKGDLAKRIDADFGDFDTFRKKFHEAAVGQFGSGWAWLVEEGGKLKIVTTSNADLPLIHGQKALLTCDVWEHAYYIDHRNARPKFLDTFLDHLANWDFAAERLAAAGTK